MPDCAICGSDSLSRSMSLPNHAVPESGRVLPVTTSIIVVLPAPFGPMMQSNSPGSTYSESLLSALKPSKLTVKSSRYSLLSRTLILSRATPYRPCLRSRSFVFTSCRHKADDPSRQKQRHQHEQRTERVKPDFRKRTREIGLRVVHQHCACDRAVQSTPPSDCHPDDGFDR